MHLGNRDMKDGLETQQFAGNVHMVMLTLTHGLADINTWSC